MTAHPIDTEALRREALAGIALDGPTSWAGIGCSDLLAILDQLATAEARIKAVERLAYAADDGTEYEHNGHDPAEGEAECPGCWALGIRRALDGDA